MRKRKKASSVAQRRLMGYAYSCATGKKENCPTSIKNIAKSFTKKDKEKGLASLRKFAKTKHEGLPYKVSESVIKFKDFINMNEKLKEEQHVLDFLGGLNNPEVNGFLNTLSTTGNRKEKQECIEDILIEVGDQLTEEEYDRVQKELKSFFRA